MNVAFVPVYVRYLGVEAYGLVGVFAMLQACLTLVDVGMRPSLSREMARYRAGRSTADGIRTLLRSIEIVSLFIAGFVALAIWGASSWFAATWLRLENLPAPTVARALVAMGVVIGLRIPENIYASAVTGLQRQVAYNAITGAMAAIRAFGAIGLLAWVRADIQLFFLWQGLMSMVTTGALAGLVHRSLPPPSGRVRFSMAALREVRRFAAGMTAITVLAVLVTQMDKVLLSRLLPLSAFSYYALAGVIASVLYSINGPITSTFNPRLAELTARNDLEALCATYHQGAQLVAVLMGSAAVMLMMFARPVVQAWTNDSGLTDQVVRYVPVLCLAVLLNGLVNMPYQLQLAHGWTRLAILTSLGALLVIGPAIWKLVPRYGALAAAWSGVAVNAAYILFNVNRMHRRILPTERWRWYRDDVLLPLAAAALVAVALRLALPPAASRTAEGLRLLGAYGLCALAATAAAPALRERPLALLRARWHSLVRSRGPGGGGG